MNNGIMNYPKILSPQFCLNAIIALRDLACEYEAEHHVVYPIPQHAQNHSPIVAVNPFADVVPDSEPCTGDQVDQIDVYAYFAHAAYNEVEWDQHARHISFLSAFYIPFYAHLRGLDPSQLSDDQMREIFLYLMIDDMVNGNRTTSRANDYDTGMGYEGLLYVLCLMGKEKALHRLAQLSSHICIDTTDHSERESQTIDFEALLSLQKLQVNDAKAAHHIKSDMLALLFSSLLRECLLISSEDVASKAYSIVWEDYYMMQTIETYINNSPEAISSPALACKAFFDALNNDEKNAELAQLVKQIGEAQLTQIILENLPLYLQYFEPMSHNYYDFSWALMAPVDYSKNSESQGDQDGYPQVMVITDKTDRSEEEESDSYLPF